MLKDGCNRLYSYPSGGRKQIKINEFGFLKN